jgi:hypothetical protein
MTEGAATEENHRMTERQTGPQQGSDPLGSAEDIWALITERVQAAYPGKPHLLTSNRIGKHDGAWLMTSEGWYRLTPKTGVLENWPDSRKGLYDLGELTYQYAARWDHDKSRVHRRYTGWPEMVELWLNKPTKGDSMCACGHPTSGHASIDGRPARCLNCHCGNRGESAQSSGTDHQENAR